MISCISGAALSFKKIQDLLVAACATHVEDTFHLGNENFWILTIESERKLKYRPKQSDIMQNAGVQIGTD